MIGYALTLVLLFPIFWMMGGAANPAWRTPHGARRSSCRDRIAATDPFAAKQTDECGRLLDYFSKKGVAYTKARDARRRW